jgi:3-hydroxyacyl-[acyl-carrier-protein] dehydratase
MLLNDFFYIRQLEHTNNVLKASLSINKAHKIFEGHFPSIPIVPGVCMMQMMREVMEQHISKKLIIRTGDNVKFLSVINPKENSEVETTIQYDDTPEGIKINATLFAGALIFFKLKAILQVAE